MHSGNFTAKTSNYNNSDQGERVLMMGENEFYLISGVIKSVIQVFLLLNID